MRAFRPVKAKAKDVTGIKPSDTATGTSYNIQSVYLHNGTMHASMRTWRGETLFYDFTIEIKLAA